MPAAVTTALDRLCATPPVNAWLLMGDEASFPTAAELRRMPRTWREECLWTGPKQVQPGDLLLFYFMAPRKAVHFVARAAGYPVFDPSIAVNAVKEVDPNQWWVGHTPLVAVRPLAFRDLKEAMGGHLNLRGKPTHFLRPEIIQQLVTNRRLVPSRAGGDEVLQVPVGDAELPDPSELELRGWRAMADGAFHLEAQVERYVVEPLVRLALRGTSGHTLVKGRRLPDGSVPDYVVVRDGAPTAVIEVKLGVRTPSTGDWRSSPDFRQVMRYSAALDVPATLVDSNRVFLIPAGGTAPEAILPRRDMSQAGLVQIRQHVTASRG